MGWFSPVKGHYPSLAQVDKTLPIAAGSAKIERGTILALAVDGTGVSKDGVFKVAGAADKLVYVSLQDDTDPTAGFAGTAFDPKGGVPAITGIDLSQEGEYETSVYDVDKTYTVGEALYAVDGKITNAGGDNVIGYVTRAPELRWVNNAIAVPDQANSKTDPRLALRTGARLSVLRFKTA